MATVSLTVFSGFKLSLYLLFSYLGVHFQKNKRHVITFAANSGRFVCNNQSGTSQGGVSLLTFQTADPLLQQLKVIYVRIYYNLQCINHFLLAMSEQVDLENHFCALPSALHLSL